MHQRWVAHERSTTTPALLVAALSCQVLPSHVTDSRVKPPATAVQNVLDVHDRCQHPRQ